MGEGCASPHGMRLKIPVTDTLSSNRSCAQEETMASQLGWVTRVIPLALAGSLAAGCSLGPHALHTRRLRYNEVIKTTSEEQLLLNIVRLRYTDTPSSVAVSTIAVQLQQQSSLQLIP